MLLELIETAQNGEKIFAGDLAESPTVPAPHSDICPKVSHLELDYRFFSAVPALKAIVEI